MFNFSIGKNLSPLQYLWIILGGTTLFFALASWFNAYNDVTLNPIFSYVSQPWFVFIPILLGSLNIYIGLGFNTNKNIAKSNLILLSVYWSILSTLLLMNDLDHGHISIISTITIPIVFLSMVVSYLTNFDGVIKNDNRNGEY